MTLAMTVLGLLASSVNYPGGVALDRLVCHHVPRLLQSSHPRNISVHIGVLPAMTGITRFLQIQPQAFELAQQQQQPEVTYSKQEGKKHKPVLNLVILMLTANSVTQTLEKSFLSMTHNTKNRSLVRTVSLLFISLHLSSE